jgi:hypothetical protein
VVSITVRHPTRKIDRFTIPKCAQRNFQKFLVFIDRGVKSKLNITKRRFKSGLYFQRLKKYMEMSFFVSNGASLHTANIFQRWCEDNLTDFIPKDEWPAHQIWILWIFLSGATCWDNWRIINMPLCPNARKLSNEFGLIYRNLWYVPRAMLVIKAKVQSIE